MKRILSFMMIILFSSAFIFAQETVTKSPSTNVAVAKPKQSTTATEPTKTNSTSETGGSTEVKANSSTSSSSVSTTETTTYSEPTTSSAKSSDFTLDHFIIGGGISAGATVSSDIISTGGILNAEFEVMIQFKHHRLGIGGDKTLMLNLRNLGTIIGTLGKSNSNLNKVYLTYEWTLFKRSPINFTAGFKFGSFDVGKSEYKTDAEASGKATTKTPIFASVGICFEVGHPRFLLYVKPEFGFHSYDTGSWRKDLFAMATVGFRWKTKRLDKYQSTTTETGKKFE